MNIDGEDIVGDECRPVREIPTTPLDLIRETEDLEGRFDGRLGGEGEGGKRVTSPITEEDESVVVSVRDKRTILAVFTEPLESTVGMKDAIGEGKLGAGRMDEILEWNGEGSEGRVFLKFERAGRPVLLCSVDGRLAIVWDV